MTQCPVVRAYLLTVRNLHDFALVQYQLYEESFEDMLALADSSGNTRVRQHQRAFYCVELMLRFVTQMADGEHWPLMPYKLDDWPRSREGLDYVIEVINLKRDELLADVTEYFYSRSKKMGLSVMENDAAQAAAEVYHLAIEACVILRQSLKNPDVPLTRVGKRLALAAKVSSHYIGDMLQLAEELSNQDELHPKRAWELQAT